MWQWFRRLGLEMYLFLTAPLVVKNCLGMLGLLGGLFLLSFWWLQCFTHHGESMEVPSYEKMTLREATRKAEARGFRVAVSDSIFKVGMPFGVILQQSPAAGSRVKENRTIYFTVTKNNPDVVKVPDLVGTDDYDQYSRKLTRLDLRPRILARISNDKLDANTILEVLSKGDTITEAIRQGVFVDKGSVIDLIVSQKEPIQVNIPDCVCHTLAEAKFLVSASNLSIGSVVVGADVTDRETAFVWRQSPRFDPNGKMRAGEQVDFYLVQRRPKGCSGDETEEPQAVPDNEH